MVLRYEIIISLEYGDELLYVFLSALMDKLSLACHLLLPKAEHFHVAWRIHLEQGIALLKSLVVAREGIKIREVHLRDDNIHETPSLLAASVNEHGIRGRHENHGNQPYVLCQTLVGFALSAHNLLLSALERAMYLLQRGILALVHALEHKEVCIVPDTEGILGKAKTLAQGEKTDAVEQIRLTLAIATYHAIQSGREVQFCLGDVLIVKYGEMFQCHIIRKIRQI